IEAPSGDAGADAVLEVRLPPETEDRLLLADLALRGNRDAGGEAAGLVVDGGNLVLQRVTLAHHAGHALRGRASDVDAEDLVVEESGAGIRLEANVLDLRESRVVANGEVGLEVE